jgi:GxxExxY protein
LLPARAPVTRARPSLTRNATTEDTDTNGGHGSLLVHGRITNGILSAAYRVHSRLGPGLLERPYRVCLCHELQRSGLCFEAEKILPLEYDGLAIDLGYRVDLLVEGEVIVEIKAVEALLPLHEAQLLSDLKLGRKRVGLLINFNVVHLRQGIRRKIYGY